MDFDPVFSLFPVVNKAHLSPFGATYRSLSAVFMSKTPAGSEVS